MTGLLITMALGAVTAALYALSLPLWAWVASKL